MRRLGRAGKDESLFYESLARTFGASGAALFALNGLVGSGIFFLPSAIARKSGAASPWVFVAAAALLAPVVAVLALLSRHADNTGGPVAYVAQQIGRRAARVVAWLEILGSLAGAAASLRMLAQLSGAAHASMVIAPVMVGIVIVQVAGMRPVLVVLSSLTIAKLVPLVAVAGVGIARAHALPNASSAAIADADADLGGALFLALFACLGFEAALTPAGEARQPRRDLARGMAVAYATAVVLYVLTQWACVDALGVAALSGSKSPVIDAASRWFGGAIADVFRFGIVCSLLGYIATAVLVGSRYPYALAKLGGLPAIFTRVHPRFGTPFVAIAVYGAAVLALALTNGFLGLVALTTLTKLVLYGVCVVTFLLREWRQVSRSTAARAGRLALGVVAAVSAVVLVSRAELSTWLRAGGVVALLAMTSLLPARARALR